MAASKTPTNRGTLVSVVDAHGNLVKITQGQAAPVTGSATMAIAIGGSTFTLSQQNVTDLLPDFTAFSNTGVVS